MNKYCSQEGDCSEDHCRCYDIEPMKFKDTWLGITLQALALVVGGYALMIITFHIIIAIK